MPDFVIRQCDLAPYPGDQAPPHVHHASDEAFYVADGALEVLVGTERKMLGAGELAVIPAGTAHTFANHGPDTVRILIVMTPEIDQLIGALHAAETDAERAAAWPAARSSVVSGTGYAAAIDAARQALISFAVQLPAASWTAAPVPGDPRPAGVIVDHVAHAYEYLAGWIGDLAAGRSVTVSAATVDALNAGHASQAGAVSQQQAADHLQRAGDSLIELMTSLQPAQLDSGDGRIRRLAEIAARHADSHRTEIQTALAAAGPR